MQKKKIGLIGFGTIGQYIYQQLQGKADFAFIYDRTAPQNEQAAQIYISTLAELEAKCASGVDLVVECAVPQALADTAATILRYSDMLCFSLTALANAELLQRIKETCHTSGHQFHVPHGAILGLDGIFDAHSIIESVTITTTKKPRTLGLADTAYSVVYDGSTRGACAAFPRNVNVHACVALAGIGFDKTHSIIIADPEIPSNQHLIEVVANGCRFKIEVASTPGDGVTGAYTPVSATASILRIIEKPDIVIA